MNNQLKAEIRLELFRCALSGKFLSYGAFYERVRPGKKMGNFPWTAHFDAIAREERDGGYPDITFLVHTSGPSPQYPSQVDFRPFDPNDKNQLTSLRDGTDGVIALYCPGTRNPYR
jgi:hypothetical protein